MRRFFFHATVLGMLMFTLLGAPWRPITPLAATDGRIAPWVLDHTANGAQAEFLVVLADQADLSLAEALPTKAEKGRYVYETLYRHAAQSQKDLRQWLTDQGAEFRSFYIINALWVKGDRALVTALARRPDVARIDANPNVRLSLPQPEPLVLAPTAVTAVELGVTNINAPQVWALGYTGQGMVVGGQDTGYRWTHAALKNNYRGWNGLTANHDYNWHDAIHATGSSCGADSPTPCDDNGHGTHTAGTAVGDDGGTNQIGVAPGAQWIGCRNMNAGNGTPTTYLECFEFFLAPYPVGGTPSQGNPALAPHVTINSWGCPTTEGCNSGNWETMRLALVASRAAGIFTVVSAGNSGFGCNTVIDPPAFFDEVYSVGAFSASTGNLASFSSRGPVTVDGSGRIKPDIAAPGVSVRSATNSGDTAYGLSSGTSMAGPHVSGAVALLWSARPPLVGNMSLTEDVLNATAVRVSTTSCSSTAGVYPNNWWGYGKLDVLAAVNFAPAGAGGLTGTVRDAVTAQPLSATVRVTHAQTPTLEFINPTLGGAFTRTVFPGAYTVTVSAAGYLTATLSGVLVSNTLTSTLPVTLQPVGGPTPVYGVALTPTVALQMVNPGQTATFPLTVTNLGNNADTFTVTVSGGAFTHTVSSAALSLPAGASQPLTASVWVPPHALHPTDEVLTLTVTSAGNPAFSATQTLTTSVNAVRGVAASPAVFSTTLAAGVTLTHTAWFTNTGNATDTFTITVSQDEAWLLPYTSSPVTLTAGASYTLLLPVRVPANAPLGQTHTLMASLTGTGTQAEVQFITTAQVYRLWLPVLVR